MPNGVVVALITRSGGCRLTHRNLRVGSGSVGGFIGRFINESSSGGIGRSRRRFLILAVSWVGGSRGGTHGEQPAGSSRQRGLSSVNCLKRGDTLE